MNDWERIRDWLTIKVEYILLDRVHTDDIIITDCPKCGTSYPHKVGRPQSVYLLVDYIIEEMNRLDTFYKKLDSAKKAFDAYMAEIADWQSGNNAL